MIRNDSIKDFIVFVNKNDYPLQSTINPSIYETNSFLINKELTLIEYAAFFGSIQIFNYLKLNGIKLNHKILDFAIHGENSEIIHSLEENSDQNPYIENLIISIKCHHNDIAKYFIDNYIQNSEIYSQIFDQVLEYYNFSFIQNELINEDTFGNICKYDYYSIVNILLKEKNIDVNKILFKSFNLIQIFVFKFQWHFKNHMFEWNYNNLFYKTAIYLAVENQNVEIVRLLLSNDEIDAHIPYVFILYIIYKILKSYDSITFKI